MKNWYLARSKPHQESWLINSLTGLGVDVYFPRITRIRRGKQIEEPLFPTYMFCHLDEASLESATVRWAPGLSYFLGVNGTPTNIPHSMIGYFKEGVACWNNRILDGETSAYDLASGTHSHAFDGLKAMFERYLDSRKRCKLLLQTLDNPNALNIERDYLRTAIDLL